MSDEKRQMGEMERMAIDGECNCMDKLLARAIDDLRADVGGIKAAIDCHDSILRSHTNERSATNSRLTMLEHDVDALKGAEMALDARLRKVETGQQQPYYSFDSTRPVLSDAESVEAIKVSLVAALTKERDEAVAERDQLREQINNADRKYDALSCAWTALGSPADFTEAGLMAAFRKLERERDAAHEEAHRQRLLVAEAQQQRDVEVERRIGADEEVRGLRKIVRDYENEIERLKARVEDAEDTAYAAKNLAKDHEEAMDEIERLKATIVDARRETWAEASQMCYSADVLGELAADFERRAKGEECTGDGWGSDSRSDPAE